MRKIFSDILKWVIPPREKCRDAARQLQSEKPDATPHQLAEHVITMAQSWSAAAGGATGALANPLIMLPAAFTDVVAVLKIEGLMAGTIAALLDPQSLDKPGAFEADVMTIVFPGAVSQALRQVGVRASQRLTQAVIRRYFTEALLKSMTRSAARFLSVKVTQKALLTKTVPLVGAGIGAGWNWVELGAVGKRAIHYYEGRTAAGRPSRLRKISLRIAATKLLPAPKNRG